MKLPKQEDRERGLHQPIGADRGPQRTGARADTEPRAPPEPLHRPAERRGRDHRAQHDQRNGQGGKTHIAGQRLSGQPADHEDDGHLRAKQRLRADQHPDIASGAAVIGQGGGIGHAGLLAPEPCHRKRGRALRAAISCAAPPRSHPRPKPDRRAANAEKPSKRINRATRP
jgi:hypothetical protein